MLNWCVYTAYVAILIFAVITTNTRGGNDVILKCFSDEILDNTLLSGETIEAKTSSVFILKKDNRVTLIHKGKVHLMSKKYTVDRVVTFSIRKIEERGLFKIHNKIIEKKHGDNIPIQLIENMSFEYSDFFYINKLDGNTYIIHGLISPIMACSDF